MSYVARYQKKPVVVEAHKYNDAFDLTSIINWLIASNPSGETEYVCLETDEQGFCTGPDHQLYIKTLEGSMLVSPGDYVIRGVDGEFYPCKPDIFEKTYSEVVDG